MYIPKAFEETRVLVLHGLIRAQSFCPRSGGNLLPKFRHWPFSPALITTSLRRGAPKNRLRKVVLTWNYAVVHAYGFLKIIEDAGWLMEHLESLTEIHEATVGKGEQWKVNDAPAGYISSLAKVSWGLNCK